MASISRPFTVFLLGLTLGLTACRGSEDAAAGAAAALPPTDVMTLTLEPKPVPQSSEFVATIRSLRSTTVMLSQSRHCCRC